MSERFIIDVDEAIIDTENENVEYCTWEPKGVEDICDLLNSLNEENIALKSSNMEYEDGLARLEEENEQLKKDLKEVHEICAYYEMRLKELKGDVE